MLHLTFAAAKVHKKNDIHKSVCHFLLILAYFLWLHQEFAGIPLSVDIGFDEIDTDR